MTQTKFYIADELVENGEQKVIIKEEMSSQEVNCLFQSFDFLSDITPAEIAYEISIRNGREFLSYMKNENLALLYFEEKTSEKALSTKLRQHHRSQLIFCAKKAICKSIMDGVLL